MRATGMAIALASLQLCSALSGAAQGPAPHVVPLTSSACASIDEGDVLALEWNPAFEHEGAVSGVGWFQLNFATPREAASHGRLPASLRLVADPRPHGALPGLLSQTPSTTPNGYLQLYFNVHLGSLQPGRYSLLEAFAEPRVDPAYTGEPPQMTNSPAHYPFCVEIAPSVNPRARLQ